MVLHFGPTSLYRESLSVIPRCLFTFAYSSGSSGIARCIGTASITIYLSHSYAGSPHHVPFGIQPDLAWVVVPVPFTGNRTLTHRSLHPSRGRIVSYKEMSITGLDLSGSSKTLYDLRSSVTASCRAGTHPLPVKTVLAGKLESRANVTRSHSPLDADTVKTERPRSFGTVLMIGNFVPGPEWIAIALRDQSQMRAPRILFPAD